MEGKGDLFLSADRTAFNQKTALVQLAVAMNRRQAKGIAFHHDVPVRLAQQLVGDAGNHSETGSKFQDAVGGKKLFRN